MALHVGGITVAVLLADKDRHYTPVTMRQDVLVFSERELTFTFAT